jgi:two-component system, OmpR family, response regulator VicR
MLDCVSYFLAGPKYCSVSFPTVLRWIENGHLKAYKHPGGGNNRIALPDFIAFLKQNDMPIPPDLDAGVPRALVVDDDQTLVKAIRLTLERAGFQTESACDGFKAGTLLASFKPCLMTLDLKMPGLSGFDVIKQVRSTPDFAHVKILVISGLQPEEMARAKDAGADDVLGKPYEMKALMSKARSLAGLPALAEAAK